MKNIPISKSSELKSLNVFINGYNVSPESILDIQLDFGNISKTGNIIMLDTIGIDDVSNIGSAIISIQYVDFYDTKYSEDFMIYRINKTEVSNNIPSLNISFIDIGSFKLKNTHINFYRKDISCIDFIKELFTEIGIPSVVISSKDKKIKEYILTNSNISLFDWMNNFIEHNNIGIIKDKFSTYIIDNEAISYDMLSFNEESEYSVFDSPKSFRKIIEYKHKITDNKYLSDLKYTKIYNLSTDNSIIKPIEKSTSDIFNKYKINGFCGEFNFPDSFFRDGIKTCIDPKNNIFKNQEMVITAIGLNNDRIMNKININISNPNATDSSNNTSSGTYIIKNVTDKINKNKIHSIIYLDRIDYIKNSKKDS